MVVVIHGFSFRILDTGVYLNGPRTSHFRLFCTQTAVLENAISFFMVIFFYIHLARLTPCTTFCIAPNHSIPHLTVRSLGKGVK